MPESLSAAEMYGYKAPTGIIDLVRSIRKSDGMKPIDEDVADYLRTEISSATPQESKALSEAVVRVRDRFISDFGQFMPPKTVSEATDLGNRFFLLDEETFNDFSSHLYQEPRDHSDSNAYTIRNPKIVLIKEGSYYRNYWELLPPGIQNGLKQGQDQEKK